MPRLSESEIIKRDAALTPLSEGPLFRTLLCKHRGATSSETFEITKLAYSDSRKSVYVRMRFTMPGNHWQAESWECAADMDTKWGAFDIL